MPLTIEALEAQLDLIQQQKVLVMQKMQEVTVSGGSEKWKVGEVSFDSSGMDMDSLTAQWTALIQSEKDVIELMRTSFPTEHVVTHVSAIDAFGNDRTDYHGENFL